MDTLIKSISALLAQPTSLFTLLAAFIFILGYLQMRRIQFTTNMLINVALMLALTIVLHHLRLFHMPQGGSVTLGAAAVPHLPLRRGDWLPRRLRLRYGEPHAGCIHRPPLAGVL